MNKQQAESAITLSLLVTGGLYAYRKITEPGLSANEANKTVKGKKLAADYKAVFGAGPPIEWGQWLKAAGSLYIGLAILGAASPTVGGVSSILVGITAATGNLIAVQEDLKRSGAETSQASKFAKGQTTTLNPPPVRELGKVETNPNNLVAVNPSGQLH